MSRKNPLDDYRNHEPYEPSPAEIAAECKKIREENGERHEDRQEPVDYSRRHKLHRPRRYT